ncbi:MAG: arginine decarboxylase [Thermaerobacter sp.]|nr:arginine decarboxylase [Thermaerobacter sp.]
MNESPVLDMLERYVRRSGARWHMPGHKGIQPARGTFLDWAYDITEVGEMLEHPNPIERSQQFMAKSYGVDRTWYSVQGATLPVMAGILAAFPPHSTLWVDRILHRSVLSALVLGRYQVRWLYPAMLSDDIILPLTEISPNFSGAQGLVLTHPTYDGLAKDLRDVIGRAHQGGLAVLVDEAHGSHWLGDSFPTSAVAAQADLVAHGTHKTEASLTQTGLLHLQGGRVSADDIDRWWRLLATSSPSYLLLASLDRLQWQRRQPQYGRQWRALADRVRGLWNTIENQGAVVLQSWAERHGFEADPARLTIFGRGAELRSKLASVGEVEKVTPSTCTLILAPGQDLSIIEKALSGIDFREAKIALTMTQYPRLNTAMPIHRAWNQAGQWVPLREAQGCVVKDALTPYPPGVPMAVPGEILSREMIEWLTQWMAAAAVPVHGLKYQEGNAMVWVVDQ